MRSSTGPEGGNFVVHLLFPSRPKTTHLPCPRSLHRPYIPGYDPLPDPRKMLLCKVVKKCVEVLRADLEHTGKGYYLVFKYLKHANDLGITYSRGSKQLDGYSDADFTTSNPDQRRVSSEVCLEAMGWSCQLAIQEAALGIARNMQCSIRCPRSTAREMMWLRLTSGFTT